MTAINDITGDKIRSRTFTEAYEENYARVFGGKPCKYCGKPSDAPCKYFSQTLTCNNDKTDD